MNYFFKYTNKKHIDIHSFRIGTLHDFRNEIYEKGVSDPDEGKKFISADVVDFNSSQPEKDLALTSHLLPLFKPDQDGNIAANVSIQNINVVRNEQSPDVYIYSLSQCFSKDLMREFGYNSCFRINNTNGFIADLTYSLNISTSNVHGRHFGPITYSSRHFDYRRVSKIHPALLKDKDEYGHQMEYRILWLPIDQEIKPLNLIVPSVSKHIELIYTES